VVRESFRLQRRLAARGYPITRYSGSAFKVDVVEGDGSVRGLDVFGGFMSQGWLYLMGEVGTPFRRAWIFPLGTCTLEGRTLPAPAEPGRMLEAMYGPGWKVPDPAFHFETSRQTVRRLNGWFRGTRTFRDDWERRYSTRRNKLPDLHPSLLAEYVVAQEGVPEQVVDLGAGRGGDAVWFAQQGASVTAYDYVPTASLAVQRRAEEGSLDLAVRRLNLLEWRSTFAEGARLAHRPGPRTVVARHLADATTRFGRDSLWRFASMVLRDGGRFYTEYWVGGGEARTFLRPVDQSTVRQGLIRHGADIVHEETFDAPGEPGRRIGRTVAQWRETTA
jgi:SAM-dependent methyltransferase